MLFPLFRSCRLIITWFETPFQLGFSLCHNPFQDSSALPGDTVTSLFEMLLKDFREGTAHITRLPPSLSFPCVCVITHSHSCTHTLCLWVSITQYHSLCLWVSILGLYHSQEPSGNVLPFWGGRQLDFDASQTHCTGIAWSISLFGLQLASREGTGDMDTLLVPYRSIIEGFTRWEVADYTWSSELSNSSQSPVHKTAFGLGHLSPLWSQGWFGWSSWLGRCLLSPSLFHVCPSQSCMLGWREQPSLIENHSLVKGI